MLRLICGVSLADRISSREIMEMCKLEDVEVVLKKKKHFWRGHVNRRSENDPSLVSKKWRSLVYIREGEQKKIGMTVFAKI